MPQLGETVTEGTITRWLKKVGDNVALDEPLFEVSTDKVDSEVPSPFAGVLAEILVPEGQTVEVGTRLAVVSGSADVSTPPALPRRQPVQPAPAPPPHRRAPPPAPVAAPSAPAAGPAGAGAVGRRRGGGRFPRRAALPGRTSADPRERA